MFRKILRTYLMDNPLKPRQISIFSGLWVLKIFRRLPGIMLSRIILILEKSGNFKYFFISFFVADVQLYLNINSTLLDKCFRKSVIALRIVIFNMFNNFLFVIRTLYLFCRLFLLFLLINVFFGFQCFNIH